MAAAKDSRSLLLHIDFLLFSVRLRISITDRLCPSESTQEPLDEF
jgi:hypothetical protein